jgi:hypothetical protein
MNIYNLNTKSKNLILCAALGISTIFSNSALANNSQQDQLQKKKFSMYGETGYRKDNLDWSISGFQTPVTDGTNDYIFDTSSALSWKNLNILETKIGADIPIAKIEEGNLYLNTSISHGLIFGGENQDSDYFHAGGETLEFSRSDNSANSGSTEDYSLSVNYEIPLKNIHLSEKKIDKHSITPILGYSIHKQNLRMTNGNQTVNLIGSGYVGPFSGLNSSYDTNWNGAFLGLALKSEITKKHEFEALVQYHINDYKAEADWNLRADFAHPKSFEHNANATGQTLNLKYKFKPSGNLSYSVALNYKKFSTNQGTDTTFLSDGSSAQVKLDKVNWDSTSLLAGLGYKF